MVRIKTSSITSLATRTYCDKIQNTLNLLASNPTWATPNPPLATIQSSLTQLSALETQSQNGDRSVIAQKRTARIVVNQQFLLLCDYLAFTVREAVNAEELINGIGLEVAKKPTGHPVPELPVPSEIMSRVSQEPGGVDLRWESASRGVHTFQIEMCDGFDTAGSNWRIIANSSKMKHTVTGLQRGSYYSFRVRCVGAGASVSEPSPVTTCLAA